MKLILWRHASANTFNEDFSRTLDEVGHQQAAESGQWLQTHYPEAEIWTSNATRARQTGGYFRTGKALAALNPSQMIDTIYPLLLGAGAEALIIVGHLPWIAHLAHYLDSHYGFRQFNHSMVMVFEHANHSTWHFVTQFQPSIVSQ